jgi:flagellum-specific peptidoglycan hydrolase FlgJ
MDSYSDTGTLITEQTKLEFTKKAKIEAEKLEAKYGIPWEVSLSQCILESGWGQSKLARKHGNYF